MCSGVGVDALPLAEAIRRIGAHAAAAVHEAASKARMLSLHEREAALVAQYGGTVAATPARAAIRPVSTPSLPRVATLATTPRPQTSGASPLAAPLAPLSARKTPGRGLGLASSLIPSSPKIITQAIAQTPRRTTAAVAASALSKSRPSTPAAPAKTPSRLKAPAKVSAAEKENSTTLPAMTPSKIIASVFGSGSTVELPQTEADTIKDSYAKLVDLDDDDEVVLRPRVTLEKTVDKSTVLQSLFGTGLV